jgi:hypothetical protein
MAEMLNQIIAVIDAFKNTKEAHEDGQGNLQNIQLSIFYYLNNLF